MAEFEFPVQAMSPSRQTAAASISLLPNEVLQIIFYQLIFGSDTISGSQIDLINPSNLANIRGTCGTWRAICSTMSFWHTDRFSLFDVIPARRTRIPGESVENYEAGFLKLFLRDKLLVVSLERRRSWSFKNTACLRTVMDMVPSFCERAMRVELLFTSEYSNPWPSDHLWSKDWEPSSVNQALALLTECRRLISLRMHCGKDETIDLWHIIRCQTIEYLSIYHPFNFINSLSSLQNLRQLVIDGCGRPFTGRNILPFESAKNLTNLRILCSKGEFCCDRDCAAGAFDTFVNLTTLFVKPLSDDMCDFLLRSNIQLTEFHTTVKRFDGHIDINKVINVLSAPSLRSLKLLRLVLDYDEAWADNWEWSPFYEVIAETITTKLDGIEYLVLGMGLDTLWFPKFARLLNLKSMVWAAPLVYWRHENPDVLAAIHAIQNRRLPYPVLLQKFNIITEAGKSKLNEVFQAEFVQKPKIYLFVMACSEEQWDDDSCNPDGRRLSYDDMVISLV
jgi:F-box-like